MILRWDGGRALADAEMIADLYRVSTRTVRRYCPVVWREPRAGKQPGVGGRVFYDAVAAATHLAVVDPRPERRAERRAAAERTLNALRYRTTRGQGKGRGSG